ncbi:hypothetical protein [Bradyrhizobium erythrophlei]|uniref:Uncharacterized protein n=1 Tax=Bradyrhizobium erythrophlei TaxID=1437360 RepID=A0A1M7UXT8_9BRAD|nr:hypothetical protein [Bradyrhizobium erythrophlei]SHN87851.1 hypothetical protein SAMN05444170_7406 [Bradyrhizobium erythrophlei]
MLLLIAALAIIEFLLLGCKGGSIAFQLCVALLSATIEGRELIERRLLPERGEGGGCEAIAGLWISRRT